MKGEDENEDPDGGQCLLPKASKRRKDETTAASISAISTPTVAPPAPVKCHDCGKTFKKQSNLQLHIEKVGWKWLRVDCFQAKLIDLFPFMN